MKLVAGLGNPGARYRGTRHNIGFEVLDELARRHALRFERGPEALVARWRPATGEAGGALLVKPLTFMNLSGRAVGELARYYRIPPEAVLVVVDDVNLELGRLRARARGSSGGHNGLRSIEEALGTQAYPRLRIGVGRGDGRRDLADHVLARFDPDEREAIERAVGRAADAVELFLAEDIARVMNEFNRRDDAAEAE
ncbi:MAG TPA: aminoacyl-tRNA hydrolase [Vicinamibacterales bacterium]|nr:aminoacyl-tRNA hydrolase [Vicinamibacterales bacterium]